VPLPSLAEQERIAKRVDELMALCEEAEESSLGPIKVIINAKNIERIIEWLVTDF
jgi:predicted RNA binding protein with dsRBD fold (UPF0201 family)